MSARYDVAILGSGIAGTTIATILARHGRRVLVLEASSHPRFAIGESTIPETHLLHRILAERHDVPELAAVASFYQLIREVAPTSGIKQHFGYVHHFPDAPLDRRYQSQCPIFDVPFGPECHLYRQDVDLWMVNVARRYGVEVRERTRVTEVDIDESGVTLVTEAGERFAARFLIDACGGASPLARRFELRDDPSASLTHSRAVFTHMSGVVPFDDVAPRDANEPGWGWHQGTLHHLFEGGWLWVIPFDNHPRAKNGLCSVGINVDPRIHPDDGSSGAQEWERLLARYPSFAAQFRQAKPVRPWIKTGRLQYSSTRTVGYRYLLAMHSTGFVDALFSRGLANSAAAILTMIEPLLDALREDDFDVARFEALDGYQRALVHNNDLFVRACYVSFGHPHLWDVFVRMWATLTTIDAMRLVRAYARYLGSRDVAQLLRDTAGERPGALAPDIQSFQAILAQAYATIEEVVAGRISRDLAARRLARVLDGYEYSTRLFRVGACGSGLRRRVVRSKYSLVPAVQLLAPSDDPGIQEIRGKYLDYDAKVLLPKVLEYVRLRVG